MRKKREVPKFIPLFYLDFLSVVTYLLFRHACNMRYSTNECGQEWVLKGICLEILKIVSKWLSRYNKPEQFKPQSFFGYFAG